MWLQDFSEIYAAIERGSFQSVDEYTHDLMASSVNEEGEDPYSAFKDGADENPIMPFGKAVTRDRGETPVNIS